MTMTDPISDLLTRIRNGQMVKKAAITCPSSNIKIAILKVLKNEGYIRDFEITENEKGKQLEISLKYFEGKPAIKEIVRISKPGMRVYSSIKSMPSIKNNMLAVKLPTPIKTSDPIIIVDQNNPSWPYSTTSNTS